MSDFYYFPDGKKPVPCDVLTWARWFESTNRSIGRTEVNHATVSTVILGSDHQYCPGGPPLLFETLVMGGELDQTMERYSTWDEAVAGHAAMVERVRRGTA